MKKERKERLGVAKRTKAGYLDFSLFLRPNGVWPR
jgi:hypothetical protein